MTWVRLDDKFHSNGKTLAAGNDGAGLYTRALSYCGDQLTDGFVPKAWADTAAPKRLREKLADVDLWEPVVKGDTRPVIVDRKHGQLLVEVVMPADGYFIPDYLATNPSRADVEGERQRKRDAGRKGGLEKARKQNASEPLAGASGLLDECQWKFSTPSPSPLEQELSAHVTPRATGTDPSEGNLDLEYAITRLLDGIRKEHRDRFTGRTIRGFADRLPPAAFHAARELMMSRRREINHDAKYVVALLAGWVEDGRYAA